MLWRRAALTLLIAATVFGQQIHLKTRNIDTSVSTPAPPARRTHIRGANLHVIVQFDHAPAAEDTDMLARAGATVLNAVPDNGVLVSMPYGASLPRKGVLWISELPAADKLSPALSRSGSFEAIVEFHPDTGSARQDAVVASAGLSALRPSVVLPYHAIVTGTWSQLSLLATEDSVAYIFPADPALTSGASMTPCAGMLTTAGPVGQYANIVHGWDSDGGLVILKYVFGTLTPKLPAASVESEIVRALNAWSAQANIVFQPSSIISALRTVYIWFASGAHGDAYPFTPGYLAHTFYPVPINPETIAGDMHLNLDVDWNIGGDIDVYSVALHEAGHAIGLGHSDKPGDVMYPYYRRGMSLSANDIGAAVALYGPAVPGSSPSPGTSASQPGPIHAEPLTITLNPPPATTESNTISLSAAVSGGTPPITVQWQTDQSYSGSADVSNGLWTATGIPLVTGANNITVTAFDAAHDSASNTARVVLTAPSASPQQTAGAAGPLSIRITNPASNVISVDSSNITLTGQATGGTGGITKVTWQTLAGASGTATGTGTWIASNIPLLQGTNTIVMRAFDTTGGSAWAALVAVRQ